MPTCGFIYSFVWFIIFYARKQVWLCLLGIPLVDTFGFVMVRYSPIFFTRTYSVANNIKKNETNKKNIMFLNFIPFFLVYLLIKCYIQRKISVKSTIIIFVFCHESIGVLFMFRK